MAVMEDEIIVDDPAVALAVDIELTGEHMADDALRRIDITGIGERPAELIVIFRKVTPTRRRIERRQQPADRFLLAFRPFRPHANDFSGAEGHKSCLAATILPTPRSAATMFHGAPTQKPSIAPAASASDVRGGGTTTSLTS